MGDNEEQPLYMRPDDVYMRPDDVRKTKITATQHTHHVQTNISGTVAAVDVTILKFQVPRSVVGQLSFSVLFLSVVYMFELSCKYVCSSLLLYHLILFDRTPLRVPK